MKVATISATIVMKVCAEIVLSAAIATVKTLAPIAVMPATNAPSYAVLAESARSVAQI